MPCPIDVIIPTIATRAAELQRAIASVQAQSGVTATPLVVVNGARFDPAFVADLEGRPGLRLLRVARPGVSNARWEGRRQVQAPFFAFLDDDDELLPDGLAIRLAAFADPAVGVVATNGFIDTAGQRELAFQTFTLHPEDPELALVRAPWLASAGGLYRTAAVTCDDLADLPDHLEITKLALRLALKCKVVRLDVPTFVKHEAGTDQVTATRRYRIEVPRVLATMEAMTSRPEIKAALRARRSAALHQCAEAAWREGHLGEAWHYHLRSLLTGGWRYLSFSRRLLTRP